MSETPEQMSERLAREVMDAADMHLSVVQAAEQVDVTEMFAAADGHCEMFQSGVIAGYQATMQVLERWGLLPGGDKSELSPEVLAAQRGNIRAAWDEGHKQGVADATSVPRTGMTYRVTANPYDEWPERDALLDGAAERQKRPARRDDPDEIARRLSDLGYTDLTCHCGRPVIYDQEGRHRGMCVECDAVRCDAYPLDCPYREERTR